MRVLLHLHATGQAIGMPEEINDVHLDVTLHGLGVIKSETHVLTSGMRTRQRIHPTPIDGPRLPHHLGPRVDGEQPAHGSRESTRARTRAFTSSTPPDPSTSTQRSGLWAATIR